MEVLVVGGFMERLAVVKRIDSVTLFRNTDKELKIMFGGNLDLYFALNWSDDNPSFLIGKDNYDIYQIFDRLYYDITNGNVIPEEERKLNDALSENDITAEERYQKIKEHEEQRRESREHNLQIAHMTGLIEGEDIVYKSDDYREDIAPYFRITKLANAYQISFGIPRIEESQLELQDRNILYMEELKQIPIRIRNSGSRYYCWNIPFMHAYHALLELDTQLEYQQISMEEYMIEQQVNQGTELEKVLTFSHKNTL